MAPRADRGGNVALVNLAVGAAAIGGAVAQLMGAALNPVAWAVLFAAYFTANRRNLRRSGLALLMAAAALALALGDTNDGITRGIAQASFLFAFLLVMQHLTRAAGGLAAVADGARLVATQGSGRRYGLYTFGAHLMSLLLQLGGLMLVLGLFTADGRSGGPRRNDSHQRPIVLAALRGFAATAFWSPVSLSILVIFTNVTDVSYALFAPLGFALAIGFLFIGQRLERGREEHVSPSEAALPGEARWIALRLAVPVATLIVTSLGMVLLFEVRLLEGVFLSVFLLTAVWTSFDLSTGRTTPRETLRAAASSPGDIANEVAIICAAAIIGVLAGAAFSGQERMATGLGAAEAMLLAGLIPVVIWLAGLLALNPIVAVSFLAGALDAAWPEAAKLGLVLALTSGWSVAACGTPFTASMLLAAHRIGIPSTTLAFRWNGVFTGVTLALSSIGAASATGLLVPW